MMETGEMTGRDSARARVVGTVADHRIILGSRKIGGDFHFSWGYWECDTT